MTTSLLKNLDVRNKKVLVRADLNVPFTSDGNIADTTRIDATIPTLKYILQNGGSIILMSHLGRPKGKKNEKYSLKPCQKVLSEVLNLPVLFAEDCIGEDASKTAAHLKPGEILLLENLRFHPAEEKPSSDPSFAKTLASYGDCFVNDAFGASHRNHSSITSLPELFPGKSAAGLLLSKEIEVLGSLTEKRPFYAIIGGAKVSSKLGILHAFIDKADALFIGGAMAFTFFKAKGLEVGDSLYEPDLVQEANNITEKCLKKNIPLFLPLDLVIAKDLNHPEKNEITTPEQGVKQGWKGVDNGPKTIEAWKIELQKAHSIFWNGPMGVFEVPPFSEGTFKLAKFLANLSSERVIGGGDSVAAIEKLGISSRFSHISTGGGASLELLESGTLPGIKALELH